MKSVEIEDKYKYMLDRTRFETARSIDNIVYMINKHMNDPDESFLSDDLFKRLQNRAESNLLNNQIMNFSVAYLVFNEIENAGKHYEVLKNFQLLYDKNESKYTLSYI